MKQKESRIKNMETAAAGKEEAGKVLSVSGLYFSYGKKEVLHGVELEITKGQILCVMGPNGSGKSTLIDCVMGINEAPTGEILLEGKDIRKMSRPQIALHAAYVPQLHNITFPYTVREAVMMGRTAYVTPFGVPPKDDEKIADEAMKRVGISELADRFYGSISGGELRLVLLARALCQQTPLILMDEPTAHLDYRNELRFLETVSELCKNDGISVLLATHSPTQAFYFESKGSNVSALFLKNGEIAAAGAPDTVITEPLLREVYGIRAKIIESEGEKAILLQESL